MGTAEGRKYGTCQFESFLWDARLSLNPFSQTFFIKRLFFNVIHELYVFYSCSICMLVKTDPPVFLIALSAAFSLFGRTDERTEDQKVEDEIILLLKKAKVNYLLLPAKNKNRTIKQNAAKLFGLIFDFPICLLYAQNAQSISNTHPGLPDCDQNPSRDLKHTLRKQSRRNGRPPKKSIINMRTNTITMTKN